MCGIVGIYNFANKIVSSDLVHLMNETQSHRGPDNGSIFTNLNIGLGHRRLSIIDLSDKANQPFSIDNEYVIVFNGEIYNFVDLRKKLELKGAVFTTNSDTEVVLYAYKFYGIDSFGMLNGMFSFAIFDQTKNQVFIVRDPVGIKPLYYYVNSDAFYFSSEIKALLKISKQNIDISSYGLLEYLWYGNPLGKNTIYKTIFEIHPGTFIHLETNQWVSKNYSKLSKISRVEKSFEDAVSQTRSLLEDSVKRQLVSDVPVGIFLSGGIDSSAITAFASRHYQSKLKTYSVEFDFNKNNSELKLAKKVAEKFNTEHYEVQITGENLIETLEDLNIAHDEPFGDAANIPLFLLSKQIKGEVKVVLQGDGGDELFGGYTRYRHIYYDKLWSFLSPFKNLLSTISPLSNQIQRFERYQNAMTTNPGYKKFALLLTLETEKYNPINVLNDHYHNELKHLNPFQRYKEVFDEFPFGMSIQDRLFKTDLQIILKDTFLEKVDKSTMANSLEVRVPFLDLELVKFALSLDAKIKIKGGQQKYLLKKALEGIVPDEILYGKKTGFSVPYSLWLKNSLKDYFLQNVYHENFTLVFNRKIVLNLFKEFLNGDNTHSFLLWKIFIMSVWLKNNRW